MDTTSSSLKFASHNAGCSRTRFHYFIVPQEFELHSARISMDDELMHGFAWRVALSGRGLHQACDLIRFCRIFILDFVAKLPKFALIIGLFVKLITQ